MRRTQLTLAVLLMAACSAPAGQSASTSGAGAPATSSNASATASTSTAPPVTVRLEEFAADLTAPIAMVSPPGEEATTYVVDQAGLVLPVTAEGVEQDKPFLDLSSELVELNQDRDDERGLLGLAFSPDYATDKLVYVFRTVRAEKAGLSHINVLSRYRTDDAGATVDLESEEEIWRLEQVKTSHAAGQLTFDDEGRLLVFMGDGQNPEDAQDPASLFGKVLAFDVTEDAPEPEILASGMRHPWRLTRDEPTGSLLFAEPNFTSKFQEVNVFTRDANYGWGAADPVNAPCWIRPELTVAPQCERGPDGQQLTPPLAEYGPSDGLIVAGAHVVRDAAPAVLGDRLVAAEWGVSSNGRAGRGRLLASDPLPVGALTAPIRLNSVKIADPRPTGVFWSLMRDAAGQLYVGVMGGRAPVPGGGSIYAVRDGA